VPRPLPLLHVRDRPRLAAPRGPRHVPVAGRGARDRARRGGDGLQGGAVHPRRPARGALAGCARVARRPRLRRHALLCPRDGRAGARGDRPAAAPQPRRHDVGGARPPQAGRAEHGHDARDVRDAAVVRAGRPALRQPRQGARGPPARDRGRGPPGGPLHHRHPRGHRRDVRRARPVGARPAPRRPRARARAGGDRPELPRQARHRAAAPRRPRPHGVPRGDRDRAPAARAAHADPGAAQPHRRARDAPAAARRRRRLGRRLAAHARPREPRAPVAAPRRARAPDRRERLRAARAAHRAPRVRPAPRPVDRPAGAPARARARRRAGPRRRGPRAPRHRVAGARPVVRRVRRGALRRAHRPQRDRRHRGPHRRPPQRLRRGVRRLVERSASTPATSRAARSRSRSSGSTTTSARAWPWPPTTRPRSPARRTPRSPWR